MEPKEQSSKKIKSGVGLEKSFEFKGFKVDTSKTLRIVWGGFSDREKILEVVKSSNADDASTLFFLDGPSSFLNSLVTDLSRISPVPVRIWESSKKLSIGAQIVLATPDTEGLKVAKELAEKLNVSHCVFSGAHKKFLPSISQMGSSRQIILEDSELLEDSRFLGFHLKEGADHVVPPISFVYHSLEFLGEPKK